MEKEGADWTHEDVHEAKELIDQGWEEEKIAEKIRKSIKRRNRGQWLTRWGLTGLFAFFFW